MGGALVDSEVVTGMVVKQVAHGIVKRVRDAKVCILGCELQSQTTETKSTVVINSAEELKAYNKGEEQMMEDAIQEIAESGVKVLVCGSTVSEMAMHFLDKYGIMMIKIQSKFELRRVSRATGATTIVRIGAPTVEECGFIGECYIREYGDRKVTVFAQDNSAEGLEGCRVSTIVIRGSTTNGLDEVERAINDGVATVKALCKDGRMLPGAGAADIALAHRIASYATTLPGLEQYAVRKFGTALEVFPRVLSENSGQRATEVIASLYAAHAAGAHTTGVNILSEQSDSAVVDVTAAHIFDSYACKANALNLAVYVTLTVLRVDQIIMAKTAGGPKPRKI
jgi:T-complex protein 1 subunit theta